MLAVHVVLVSFILSFGQVFKQSKKKFESDKEIKTKVIDGLKAIGSLTAEKNKS